MTSLWVDKTCNPGVRRFVSKILRWLVCLPVQKKNHSADSPMTRSASRLPVHFNPNIDVIVCAGGGSGLVSLIYRSDMLKGQLKSDVGHFQYLPLYTCFSGFCSRILLYLGYDTCCKKHLHFLLLHRQGKVVIARCK